MCEKSNYPESMRIEVSKQMLIKNNNLVLLYLHDRGVSPKRNSRLQRAVQSILFEKYKIKYFFFQRIRDISQMIDQDYDVKITERKLLSLVKESRRLKGRPVYNDFEYESKLKGKAMPELKAQLRMNL